MYPSDQTEIRLWSLGNQKCTWSSTQAHKGFVKGLCFVPFEDSQLLSVGDDKTIKLWDASKSDVRFFPSSEK